MIALRAAWCVPVAGPPRRRGVVLVERGRVVEVTGTSPAGVPVVDLPRHAVLPALVNAHTHLELSWMAGRVARDTSMPAWAGRLVSLRREAGADDPAPMRAAIAAMRASGTGLVGDIGNTLASVEALAEARMPAVVFAEVIGFRGDLADERLAWGRTERDAAAARVAAARVVSGARGRADVRVALAAHAPYSSSPALLAGVAREAEASAMPWSLHLAESVEEITFLRDGNGPWRALLESLGSWDPAWTVPRCAPVEYLARLGVLGPRLVAVHGVQLTGGELARLREAGVSLVACPRSNEWTGAGPAPLGRFIASDVRLALGTDSLASADSLSMFDELASARALAPEVPPARLVRCATRDGARALGWDAELGTIEPGKRAAIIGVELPAAALEERVHGPEAWLLEGVAADRVSWPGLPDGGDD